MNADQNSSADFQLWVDMEKIHSKEMKAQFFLGAVFGVVATTTVVAILLPLL